MPDNKNSELDDLIVDPSSEDSGEISTSVSAKDEADFFEQARAEFLIKHHQQNLGLLGSLFGSNANAATNIAGLVILVSLTLLAVSLFVTGNSEIAEARTYFVGMIASALSYIFGASTKK
jgi:hypothetical protein